MFQKTPFGRAVYEDPQFRLVMDGDFWGFFSQHGATADHDFEGLKLIWWCL
jgi:hypothetical protein